MVLPTQMSGARCRSGARLGEHAHLLHAHAWAIVSGPVCVCGREGQGSLLTQGPRPKSEQQCHSTWRLHLCVLGALDGMTSPHGGEKAKHVSFERCPPHVSLRAGKARASMEDWNVRLTMAATMTTLPRRQGRRKCTVSTLAVTTGPRATVLAARPAQMSIQLSTWRASALRPVWHRDGVRSVRAGRHVTACHCVGCRARKFGQAGSAPPTPRRTRHQELQHPPRDLNA